MPADERFACDLIIISHLVTSGIERGISLVIVSHQFVEVLDRLVIRINLFRGTRIGCFFDMLMS